MQNLGKVTYITRYFGALQGLKVVPFGVLLMLISTRWIGWTWLVGKDGDLSITLPLFLICIASWVWICRYYTRTFGSVQPISNYAQTWGTAIAIAYFVLLIVDEVYFHPPFSPLGLGIAVGLLVAGLMTQRIYYLPFALAIAGASFLPTFLNVPLSDRIWGSLGFVISLTIGFSVTAMGLIDHFRLVKTMRELAQSNQTGKGEAHALIE